jgi:hypothetical protein
VLALAAAVVPLPTNMDLVIDTVERAVDQGLAHLEAPADVAQSPLLVVSQSKHDANWLIDHVLTGRLLERGFAVTLDSTAVEPSSMRLSYRVLDLGVTGHSGLRGGQVTRQSRVTLALRLSRESDDAVYWQQDFTQSRQDRIPKSQLEILQNTSYSFARTELEEQSWSKFAEPIIVSTVLGGLIYLFFSNR